MDDFEIITRNTDHFIDRLCDLKKEEKFCDFKLIVNQKKIPLHKNILVASSKYFDIESGEIVFEDWDLEIAESLIEYFYTGKIRITEKNSNDLAKIANILEIPQIFEACENFTIKKLNPMNCISAWETARQEEWGKVEKSAFEYILKNFENVSQSPQFLELSGEKILEILKSNVIVKSEMAIYNSIKNWLKHESTSKTLKKQFAQELLKCIQIKYLPKKILDGGFNDICEGNLGCFQDKGNYINAADKKNPRDTYSTMIAIGQNNNLKADKIELFDITNDEWVKIETAAYDVLKFSAVLWEDKLILIGGLKNFSPTNTVLCFDLKTGAFENLPPMNNKRSELSAVEYKGSLYAIGGYKNTGSLSSVEMWNQDLEKWKELTSMPTSRYGCKAKVLDDEIYVIGGCYVMGKNSEYLSVIESYNPAKNEWTKRTSMNEKRLAPGVAVIGKYLYVVGGIKERNVDCMTAERYDPSSDNWTMINSIEISRSYLGAGNIMGNLAVIGGYTGGVAIEKLSTAEIYDEEAKKWTSMSSLNGPRAIFETVEIPWVLAKLLLERKTPV